jgi:CPA1 family monovalent cation:H+ antiporter
MNIANRYSSGMDIYAYSAILLTGAIGIAYVNQRYIRMPTTIAIMLSALLLSLGFLGLDAMGYHPMRQKAAEFLSVINFHDLLINGMLSFLLFAGALNIDINELRNQKWEIGILATAGTIASTLLVGISSYYLLHVLGFQIPFAYTMLFGALISPTDPIAVLSIFKRMKAPRKLSIKVEAESLFNDGVGIVIFLSIYQLIFTHTPITFASLSILFLKQAAGGIIFGTGLGLLAYWLMKPIDDHKVEILLTLAVATGGYTFAQMLGISGPLAMVAAGLLIGNHGRNFSMSISTKRNLDTFWELIDEILNAVLFLLIGLELVLIDATWKEITAAIVAVPLVLSIRYITVGTPISILKLRRKYVPHAINIMTWGGLRGGLAVALALSIPAGEYRHLILVMTYAIVLFSVLVQGLTVKHLIKLSVRQ